MIYPIFLPHAGCPFQCVYCNQRAVVASPSYEDASTGVSVSFREQFRRLLGYIREKPVPGEIAFYGGGHRLEHFVPYQETVRIIDSSKVIYINVNDSDGNAAPADALKFYVSQFVKIADVIDAG